MLTKIRNFLFTNQTVRQTIVKNTFWISASNIIGRLLRAAIIIYAARILGATSWGAFSYALSLASFLTIFSDIGITALITREGSRSPELRNKYLATGMFVKIFLLVILGTAFYMVVPFINQNAEVLSLIPVVILLTAFDGLRDLSNSLARASEKFEIETGVNIFTNIAILALGFLALYYVPTSKALAIGYTLGSGFGFVAIVYSLRQYFSNLFQNISFGLIKPIITQAWPFGLMGLMGALMINTDVIMVGFFRSIEEVGYYSAALRPIQLLYLVPGLIAVPLFPLLSRIYEDRARFVSILKRSIRLVTVVALPLTAGGILLGPKIIDLFYGQEYALASSSFQILSITFLITFPSILIGNAIYATNRQKILVIFSIIGMGGNILLDFIFIPKYGIVGSAWATVFVQIISNGYAWYSMRDYVNLAFVSELLPSLLATFVMSVIILFLNIYSISVVATILFGVITYFVVLILLREKSLFEIKSVFG